MNFKKIAITAAAAGVMLSAALPVFAGHRSSRGVELDIDNDDTTVTNNVLTLANTGFNQVNGGRHHGGGAIFTGDATAYSEVVNMVNWNEVDLCECLTGRRGGVKVDIDNEDTTVTNRVGTVANTGFNQVNGRGLIGTGDAWAGALVENVVNTNIVN